MSDTPSPAPQRRLRRAGAAQYLNDVHGIPYTEKTLRNRNAAGLEPLPEYLGTIPFYTPQGLDDFARTAFTPESPVTVTRRRQAAIATARPEEPATDILTQPEPAERPRKRGRKPYAPHLPSP
jgi:hypothetical protein